jgi:hypothetical protein
MDVLRYISRRILAAPTVLSPGSTSDFFRLFLGHDTRFYPKNNFRMCVFSGSPPALSSKIVLFVFC